MGPILETARLVLRPIRRSDATRIQEVFPNMEVMRYLAGAIPWPYPENGAEVFIAEIMPEIEEGQRIIWAITERGDDALIGLIELSPFSDFNRGFWLIPEHHRKGYMTEAVYVVNDYAFNILGMAKMRLGNAEPNVGSSKLKAKSGATLVGYVDDVAFVSGTFREEVWELTAEQWRENRHRFLGV